MRILIISDPHNREKDFEERLSIQDKVLSETDYDLCVVTGDLFDKSKVGGSRLTTQQMVKSVMQVYTRNQPVVLIEGNHDQLRLGGSALDLVNTPNIFKVQNEVQLFSLNEVSLACIPWIPANKDYKEFVLDGLNKRPDTRHRLLFGHVNLVGASGPFHVVASNDYFSFFVDDFADSPYAPTQGFFGHVHERQPLGRGMYYTGALTPIRFGDDWQGGVCVWENGSVTWIPVESRRYYRITQREFDSLPEDKKLEHNYKLVEVKQQASYQTTDFGNLVDKFCQLKNLSVPNRPFVKDQISKFELEAHKLTTGLDRVVSLKLHKVNHVNYEFNFTDGINAVVGRNGTGKSTSIDAILAGMYDTLGHRGSLKNFMKSDSLLELVVESQGETHTISKKLKRNKVQSTLDGEQFELSGQFWERSEKLFGEMPLLTKLVYMDQRGDFDMVERVEESKRIDILAKLLNLEFFKSYEEQYKELLARARKQLDTNQAARQTLDALEELKASYEAQLDLLPALTAEDVKNASERLQEARERQGQRQAWLAYKTWLDEKQRLEKALPFDPKSGNDIEALWGARRELTEMPSCASNPDCGWNHRERRASKAALLRTEELHLNLLGYDPGDKLNYYYQLWTQYALHTKFPPRKVDEVPDLNQATDEFELITKQWTKLLDINGKIASVDKQLDEARSKLVPEDSVLEQIEDLEFLLALVSRKGLPLFVIDQACEGLQAIIDDLTKDRNIHFGLRLVTSKGSALDGFQLQLVHSDGRDPYDVKLSSGGELALAKFIFKLAMILYLNSCLGNYKVLIMDEPEKGLDEFSLNVMVDMLDSIRSKFNQVIVVTHSDTFEGVADRVFRLTRRASVS